MIYRLAWILLGCLWVSAAAAQSAPPSPDESQLFRLLNQERARRGLPQFELDAQATTAARAHSQRMAAQATLSHQLPGEKTPGTRLGESGLRATETAENVAFAGSIEQAHDGLMRSPPHLANIENPHYNRIGIGVSRRDGRLYVTEDFAHAVPVLSDDGFRAELVAALNRGRRAHNLAELLVTPTPSLHQAACAEPRDLRQLHQTVPDAAELVVFTAAEPNRAPSNLDRAADNPSLHRVGLGVCFRPGPSTGYASFWVVAAFYR
jgi:uncharacterized protein YkwD